MTELTSGYCIRALTSMDQDVIWELLYEALFVPPGTPPFPREFARGPELSRYAANWGGGNDLGLIAVTSDGQPMGAAWLRLLVGEERGYGWVDDNIPELGIALFPEYRGMGIGTDLLTRLLVEAAGRYPGVSLSADLQNPAVKLYEKLGFEVAGRVREGVVMVKMLDKAQPVIEDKGIATN